MPILQGDIKLLKSERMTDNEDGGGRITGNAIEDGLSNEIFNDVSDLDRVYGRTSLRKTFASVQTDDTDLYFGSHVIIDQTPEDPNVSVLAFSTDSPTDQRVESRQWVEGYVVAGPMSRLRLYGDQLAGQRQVMVYQRVGDAPPDIGDVLVLSTESGTYAGEEQFIRITGVEREERVFNTGGGDFTREVLTLGISTELGKRFYGHEPTTNSSAQPPTRVRTTQVADASRYYGVSKLALNAALGSNQVQVDSVYKPIVPSTQGESAVVDVRVGGQVTVNVESGGIIHDIPQVAETLEVPISLNNRGYSYTRNLQPLPAPGTVVVEYMVLGKWYQIRDDEANGELAGSGTGQVNFATGSLSITLQELPDVGSSILIYWGSPVHYEDRAGYTVPFPTPGLRFELDHGGVLPGSVTATWLSGGAEVTASDDGLGNITGSATGVITYGFQDTDNGDQPGFVWIEFADGAWPDANAQVVVSYEYGASESATFNPSKDGAGFVQLQLPNAPIKPGSVALEWQVMRRDETNNGENLTDTGFFKLKIRNAEVRNDSETLTYIAYDDGAGGIEEFGGSVDYETGLVTLEVEKVHNVRQWRRETYSNDSISMQSSTNWNNTDVRDVFSDGAAVIARFQPQVIGSTQASVSRNPSPLAVALMPLLQDQVVPGTLRFTFRGSTYEDRDGSLYRDVDPNTGAGYYSGTINYDAAEVVLEDWGEGGSNQISITSLVSVFGNWTIYSAFFRTPGNPIKPGELSLLATTAEGTLLQGQAQLSSQITGDQIDGSIEYETGVTRLEFGERVDDSTLTTEEKNEDWYDPAEVDENGMIWRPTEVLPSTCRFNTVVLTSLPLDADLLGLDPVRLPPDGRVPIFRPAQVAVVHHTARTPWPLGTLATETLDVGRTRLALAHIEDNTGTRLAPDEYSVDLNAGIFTIAAGVDLSGYTEPLYAVHRIEDMVLISDVQINGQITLIGQLSHDYPAEETLVSSALIGGDLQARWSNLFDQSTWTNVWRDDLIGSETSAEYNATTYPLTVTNRGAITERWALRFTSNSGGNIIGESVGQIGVFSINEETAPLNPNTGVPYFRIAAGGWGSGWSSGNVLRFNTIGCTLPIWLSRTVLQGDSPGGSFQFRVQVRGNVDA